jgi:hypothetical protein
MRCGQMPVFVLNEMQMLDQKIAAARTIGQQRLNFFQRIGLDLTASGRLAGTAAAATGSVEAFAVETFGF